MAGGIAIDQGTEGDLVGDAGADETYHHDADHDPEHGGAAIEQFSGLELLRVDQLLGPVLEPLVVGGGVCLGSSDSVGMGPWS